MSSIFMQRALELAELGRGTVSPNPMVGCVVVHQNQIIGEGFHQQYGQPHAEVNAIANVERNGHAHKLSQATAYVTLEPCAHFGKTPPCVDLLINKKIKKVVVSNLDPNPLVAGKGLQKLHEAGIEVQTDVLAHEGRRLNVRFFTAMEHQRPYVILKWAQTTDGFMGDNTGKPLIISDIYSRTLSHRWRTEEDAILVGTNTARIDNPQLNARLWAGRNPIRVVIDQHLRLPASLRLFDDRQPTIVFTAKNRPNTSHIEAIKIDFEVDFLEKLLHELYLRKIQSVIVEGGSKLLQTCIDQHQWDEARVFVSAQTIGSGVAAPSVVYLRQLGSVFSHKKLRSDNLICIHR
jgi:diaminohydroxyphosphoribosylaminopyrimidine deaminase / 5-amino-6-(5-phosphoribosylamino)uracil reductase